MAVLHHGLVRADTNHTAGYAPPGFGTSRRWSGSRRFSTRWSTRLATVPGAPTNPFRNSALRGIPAQGGEGDEGSAADMPYSGIRAARALVNFRDKAGQQQ